MEKKMKKGKKVTLTAATLAMALNCLPAGISAAPITPVTIQQETAEQTPENVALNKPCTAAEGTASRAVDGNLSTFWDGGVGPADLIVDLQDYYNVSSINLVPYYGGSRSYLYEIYTSSNGVSYEKVAEKTEHKTQTSAGETYEVSLEGVRYVKVRMIANTANSSVHINELRVMGTPDTDFVPEDKPEVDPEDADNIAYGKPTRSSMNNGFSSMVVDGNRDTAWVGRNVTRFVDVDLMDNYDITSVKVYMPQNASYGYNLYGSLDGVHFESIARQELKESPAEGDEIVLETPKTYRVLRVLVTNNSQGQGSSSSVSEIRAYGTKSDTPVTETRERIELTSWEDWMQENYDVDIESLKDENGKYDVKDTYTDEDVYAEVRGVISRILGDEYQDWFTFELAPEAENGNDWYELSWQDGKVLIRGNEGLSLTSGLNYYLKYWCNVHVAQQTSQVNMPEAPVEIKGTVRKETPYETRYAYNYCTLSYTMPFWGYDEWQREMDWFALNGVNLILDTTATEALWIEYLMNYGYTADQAKDFVCGYVYKAWWLMGNMESYGGPVSDEWVQDTVQMARVNQRKMTVLGMEPCLQGFMGVMPNSFAEVGGPALQEMGYSDITPYLVVQGDWGGGFDRPPLLKTSYDGWYELADTFYETQEKIYGQVTHSYAGDLAHEGGIIPSDLSKAGMSAQILKEMMDYDDQAVWIIQSWEGNPDPQVLKGFGENREDHVLVLDLNATADPRWNNTTRWNGKEFGGTSWIYCMLDNYGGRNGVHGELETLATQIPYALKNSEHMKGVGITPEGTLLNPIAYDLFWEMIWEEEPVDVDEWLEGYLSRRYGAVDEASREAWEILLDTAYHSCNDDGSSVSHSGGPNCITNMRPSMNLSTWLGSGNVAYDSVEFEKALDLLMEGLEEHQDNECYVYDTVDMLRQAISNVQWQYYNAIKKAYNEKDQETFMVYKEKLLNSILMMDEVSAFDKDTVFGNWIGHAEDFWNDERTSDNYDDFSKDMMTYNAKQLISTWSHSSLQTYANRSYSGLLTDYYYKMWELWLNRVEESFTTGKFVQPNERTEYHPLGWNMVVSDKKYETEPTPVNGTDTKRSLKAIWEDFSTNYSAVRMKADEVTGGNVATSATAYAQRSEGGKPASNINDGNPSTMWVSSNGSVPVYCGLEFDSFQDIHSLELTFETRPVLGNNVMNYYIEARQEDGTWKKIYEGDSYDEENKVYTVSVSLEELVHTDNLRMTYTSNGGIYPALAEFKAFASPSLQLLANSDLFVEEDVLKGVPDDMTAADLKNQLVVHEGEVQIIRNGEALADDALLEDGDTVNLVIDGVTCDTWTVSMGRHLKEELQTLVDEVKTYSSDHWSPISWKTMQNELTKSEELLSRTSVKYYRYKKAFDSLQKAASSLINVQPLTEGWNQVREAGTQWLSAQGAENFTVNRNALQNLMDSMDSLGSSDVYRAYGLLENVKNWMIPADSSNAAARGTGYAQNYLDAQHTIPMINDGNPESCWVANSRTTFPVYGGVTLAESVNADSVRVVFEQNGYRNTQIGFTVSAQLEDGSWHDLYTNRTGSRNGYTFEFSVSEALASQNLEGKIRDVRVTMTDYSTDAGIPYPGVAEIYVFEKIDKTTLTTAKEQAEKVLAELDETSSAADTIKTLIERADDAADGCFSQNFIDQTVARLDQAVNEGLKADLSAQITAAEELKESDWTAESWTALQSALANAKAVMENESSTISDLQSAADQLKEARKALAPSGLHTALEDLIARTEAMDLSGYTDQSKEALNKALESAKAVLANEEATQADLQSAMDALNAARAGLKLKVNKSLLQAAVDYAHALQTEGALEHLNEIVLNEFNEALGEAEGLLTDTAADQETGNASWLRLTRAIQMTGFTSDKSELLALIAEAESLQEKDYRPDGWQAFQDTLAYARTVADDDAALDEVSIQKAVTELKAAMAALIPMPSVDTTLLSWLVQNSLTLEEADYLPDTWQPFQTALTAAQEVLADPADQASVDEALMNLHASVLNLRLRADEELLKELTGLVEEMESLNLALCSEECLQSCTVWTLKARAVLEQPAEAAVVENLISEGSELLTQAKDELEKLPAADEPAEENKKPAEDLKDPDADQTLPQTPADSDSQKTQPAENDQKADSSVNQSASVKNSVKTAAASHSALFSLLGLGAVNTLLAGWKRRKNH